jgi:hypothetical protein
MISGWRASPVGGDRDEDVRFGGLVVWLGHGFFTLSETRRQRDALQAEWTSRERKVAALDRKIASIFRTIADGLYEPAMNARQLSSRRSAAEGRAFDPTAHDVLMRPQLAERYRCRIERLERLLEGSEHDEERISVVAGARNWLDLLLVR